MSEKSKSVSSTSASITIVSVFVQVSAYMWLFSQDTSGPLGGLIIIPGAGIVLGCLLIHLILYGIFRNHFRLPLLVTVAFWTIGLLVPFIRMQAKNYSDEKEGEAMMEAHVRRFRDRVELPLRKRYGDSATYFENGFAVRSAAETFTVSYGLGPADMILFIMQPMTSRPSEHDTALWLKKIELMRPLLFPEETGWLDSAKSTRSFTIYNSQVSRPEYPLELHVEFKGRTGPFLYESYKEAYPDIQFQITLYTHGIEHRDDPSQ